MAHIGVLEHILITLNSLPLMTHLIIWGPQAIGKSNGEDSVLKRVDFLAWFNYASY